MPRIERSDLSKIKAVPNWLKLILLAAFIFGIYMKTAYRENQAKLTEIYNVKVVESTRQSADVGFSVKSYSDRLLDKKVLIAVYVNEQKVGSKITIIKVEPRSDKRYIKVLNELSRGLGPKEKINKATVEIYEPSAF